MENQEIIIARAEWGAVAADLLRGCFSYPAILEEVAEQVRAGLAELYTADDGGGIVAAFVLRIDGREGVIVAASGPAALVTELLPHIEARFTGCEVFRIHTMRPAVARILAGRGYAAMPAEIVLRKAA